MVTGVVEKDSVKGNIIEIVDKKDINHFLNSFRLKEGDKLRIVDGEKEYLTKIINISKKMIECEIEFEKLVEKEKNIQISAGIGMLKNDKMELTIQKLTEVGIDRIIPLKLDRTIVKIEEKKEKWDIVAKDALKQCQGIKFMEIDKPKTLKDLEYNDYDLILVPYENEEEVKIREIIKNRKDIKSILYIIGSEGGISENEIDYLREKGAQIVTLGKRILRAETAAIVVGGVLVNEF